MTRKKRIAYISSIDKKLLDSGRLLKDDRGALVESRTNTVMNNRSQYIKKQIDTLRELQGKPRPTPPDRGPDRGHTKIPNSKINQFRAIQNKLGAIERFTADDQYHTWKSYGASSSTAKKKAYGDITRKTNVLQKKLQSAYGPAINFPKPKPKTVFNRMLETHQKLRTGLETGVHKAISAATNTNAAKNKPYVSSYLPGASKPIQPKAKPYVNPAVGQGYAGLGAVEMNKRKAQHTAMANIAKAKHQEASSRLSDMTNLIGAHGSDPAFLIKHGQSVSDSYIDAQKKIESAARDYSKWTKNKAKFDKKPKRKPRKME